MQYTCSIFSTANEDKFSSDPLQVTCKECRGKLEEAQKRERSKTEEYCKEWRETYIILRDRMHFAAFHEGDESRYGTPMSYPVFIEEFRAYVAHCEELGYSKFRFSYVVRLEIVHRIVRAEK
jgi:hypothetical protein